MLEITGITVTQSPAGVILGDGGEVHLNGSQTINGGTLRTANGGTVNRSGNGNTTMSDVFIDCDVSLVAPSGLIYGSDTLACTGTVAINDASSVNNSFVQFNANTTLSGGGRLFLGGSGNDSQVITSASTFTIAPDFTVEGSGDIAASLINNGLVRAFPSANGDGRLRLYSLSKTNNSQMVADTGGVLEITGMTITQNAEGGDDGELLADGGIVEFNGSQTVNGGVMRTANGGRLVKIGNGNLTASDLTLEGDLELQAPSGFLYGGLSFVNNGVVRINTTGSANNGYMQFNADTVITGDGRFALEGGGDDSQLITSASTATFGPDQRVEGEGKMFGSYVLEGVLAPG
ncbi:MAG: hypothetical protein K8E66_10785, partial [Phycisphaerales bacterium]|nr:hypothetical protein [Phycisphaerales bacterium]